MNKLLILIATLFLATCGGAPDPRWNDDELGTLRSLSGSDFEVVQMETIETG